MDNQSDQYDSDFLQITHYRKYPEMLPWIGANYSKQPTRILIFGESHYLDRNSVYHHDVEQWYTGIDMHGRKDASWIKTRGTIGNGIETKWKKRSKSIYRNIESALFSSKTVNKELFTAFTEIAFMNFFQRPAETTGDSIKVSPQDVLVAIQVSEQVVESIRPDLVIFTSSLAFKHAKSGGLLNTLANQNISFTRTPHPGSAWWNRVSRKYNNKTGKDHFISFINEVANDQSTPAT